MAITNKWLTPLQRSFNSIKERLMDALSAIKDPNNPSKSLITDKSEGNIFTILISMLSAIAEVLHYYIDNVARESFLPSARRYDSLLKHAGLVDYHPKGAIAPVVDVTLTRDSKGSTDVLLASGDTLKDTNGNTWILMKDMTFASSITFRKVTLYQMEPKSNNEHNTEEIVSNRYLILGLSESNNLYVDGSLQLRIGTEEWAHVKTFAKSKPTDKHFIAETLQDGKVMVVFGDGVNGAMADTSTTKTINLAYYLTKGAEGSIGPGGIDTTWPNHSEIQVKNNLSSGAGSNLESFDTLQRRIPLSIKTLDVAITKEDFKDLAMTLPEVGQAEIEYICGRKLNVYIATVDGEIAPQDLLDDVKEYILQHCPLTTWVSVKSVGLTNIILDINITGKKSYKKDFISTQVLSALGNTYSKTTAKIGGSVRLSDIYALIDNLSSVDYLTINKFYLKPWPKILYGQQLIINTYTLIECKVNMEYILEVTDGKWSVYSKYNGYSTNGIELRNLTVNDTVNGNSFTMSFDDDMVSILEGSNFKYSVYITKNSLDYEEPGYNLPYVDITKDVKLNITETL